MPIVLTPLTATIVDSPWNGLLVQPDADELLIDNYTKQIAAALNAGQVVPAPPAAKSYTLSTPFDDMTFQYKPATPILLSNIYKVAVR
jgi:hypothetical protein